MAVSVRVESDASRAKWRRATNVCSVGHRKVEKELSMRCREAVLLAKRLHETGATLTVEAEKGNLWNIDTGPLTLPIELDPEEKGNSMSKPSDIPQDVWDAAVAVVGPPDGLGYAKVFTDRVARAIAAERERCAKIEPAHPIELPRATYGFVAVEAYWAGVQAAKDALRAAIRSTP